jgi:hypothetical protein
MTLKLIILVRKINIQTNERLKLLFSFGKYFYL